MTSHDVILFRRGKWSHVVIAFTKYCEKDITDTTTNDEYDGNIKSDSITKAFLIFAFKICFHNFAHPILQIWRSLSSFGVLLSRR